MAVGQFFWSDDIYSIRSDIMIHRYSEQWSSVNTSLESDPCGWSIPRYYDNSNRALWRSRQPLRARTKPRRSWIDTPSLQQQEVYLQSLSGVSSWSPAQCPYLASCELWVVRHEIYAKTWSWYLWYERYDQHENKRFYFVLIVSPLLAVATKADK